MGYHFMSIILTKIYPNQKFQEIKVTKFPLVIITDSHTNLNNIEKVRELYPNNSIICLGDITFLFARFDDPYNGLSVDYFIRNKIPCLQGNHDSIVCDKFDLFKPQKDYLKSLPVGFRLVLPDGNYYLCYHNEPSDLWSHYDDLDANQFCDKYPVSDKCLGIIQGHLHRSFIREYKGLITKRISVGQLCNSNHHTDKNDGGNYALLTENGIEFKKL